MAFEIVEKFIPIDCRQKIEIGESRASEFNMPGIEVQLENAVTKQRFDV